MRGKRGVDTGLYYYGARYYDPRISIWLSVDPLADFNPHMNSEHYIDGQHNGGIYNSFNHGSYIYCYQSPIVLVDPNGKQVSAEMMRILNNFGYQSAAAIRGSSDAIMQATTLGITDVFGISEHSSNYRGMDLVSYYIGRALTDIAMITIGTDSAITNASLAIATSETIIGGIGFGVASIYSGGTASAGAVDLNQTLVKLMAAIDAVYENPGHHDAYPKQKNPNNYNPKKSVLPENHKELWEKSVADPKNKNARWTKEGKGKKATYHRFEGDSNGKWHWNGSTNGKTKSGKSTKIPMDQVPNEIKKL